jgi:hypothetical protein
MEMMRVAKDVEAELQEEDEGGDRRVGKKMGYERSGLSDWVGSSKNKSGYQPKGLTRPVFSSGSNPNF